ncbi:MAG: type I methionyl aminopeptidase [Lachnospiraceae bacterium]|nr:type I methionyl aminopeptidase [Lachnospiraceae bacterium]
MRVSVKTEREIELMREAGRKLEQVHLAMRDMIRPGISTKEIDECGEEMIRRLGGIPNFKNYDGFPAAICVSVNDEVVHGIPDSSRILEEGDIVSLDAGLIWKGYHSDAARTWGVGRVSEEARRLMDVTRQCFFEGIRFARAGAHLEQISAAIYAHAEDHGYGVIRELSGHGIGTHLHEPPVIPNYPLKGRGLLLVPGMTLAIEPMINEGGREVIWSDDGWTVRTEDGSRSAHYENTVLITEGEPELLTEGQL